MKKGIIFLTLVICAVAFPFAVLLAQENHNPVLDAIDFATSEGQLTMWLSFDGNITAEDVDVKRVHFPQRYIVSVTPAGMSENLREGVIYQDILSDRSMGVEIIEFTYDYARESLAFIAYPWEGLEVDANVQGGCFVVISYRRVEIEEEASTEPSIQPLPKIEPAPEEEGDFQDFFSLNKATLHLSPEAESIIRSYFAKKKIRGVGGETAVLLETDEDGLQPASGRMSRPEYRIQVGDKLALGVAGEPELDMTVQVRPDGYISFPIIGDVYVEGKTADEVRHAMRRMLQPYYSYNLVVNVIVTEFTPEKVYLLGKVFEAGPFPFKPGMTLLDLIGHYDERDADIGKVKLIRGDEVHKINLYELLGGEVGLNYRLEPGDYVVFPAKILPKASIIGKVKRPGEYPFEEGQRLYDLIGIAGGFDERCDIKKVIIIRLGNQGFESHVCNLLAYQREGAVDQNPVIVGGDLIIVPEVGRADWYKVIRTLDSLNTFAFWWRFD
jgi:polysaccharide export outer membrane protein